MELNCITEESLNIRVSKTEKYWVQTNQGRLLDTMSGNTAFIFGYDNSYILNRMYEIQKEIGYLNFKHNENCEYNDELIKFICDKGNWEGINYAVSGTDAVECALAISDYYWKLINPFRSKIVSFSPGYHGATYFCRMLRGEENHSEKIIVVNAPEWDIVDRRLEEEKKSLIELCRILDANKDIGSVIFESIPWYKGIRPWSDSWWTSIKDICNRYDVLLILDDIMGGVGKIGPYFSYHRYNIQPDIVAIGKSFTGGYSPLSCACVNKKVTEVIKQDWLYGHTWQPNMAGVGAALAVKDMFEDNKIFQIESRMIELKKKLLDQNLIKSETGIGLIHCLRLINPMEPDQFVRSGLTGGPGMKDNISMCVPYIADDEYFFELENRLIKCLARNQK
jgi:adenosylmethionine-8-amino-7-oxononanoate aminotransferase